MLVDAIVLTGGRSSRLDFAAKSELHFGGETLLSRTLWAVQEARRIVIVGSEPSESLPVGVLRTREVPQFSGPVAGIEAGMLALADSSPVASDAVLVLACDMPHIDRAVPELLRGLAEYPKSDGVIAVDAERLQPLAAGYRTSRLAAVLLELKNIGQLAGVPVFHMLRGLNLNPVSVPAGATADVDTWSDARRLGVESTAATREIP